jgi:hypothetical protein
VTSTPESLSATPQHVAPTFGLERLRMAGRFGAKLAEAFEVVDAQVIARDVQEGVKQSGPGEWVRSNMSGTPMGTHACPFDKTSRSRLTHPSLAGLATRCRDRRTCAVGAIPMGAPAWMSLQVQNDFPLKQQQEYCSTRLDDPTWLWRSCRSTAAGSLRC